MAYVISDDCIACGTCISECPSGAISEGEKYSIDPEVCTECGPLLFGLFRALSNVYTGFDALVALKLPSTLYNMFPYIISLIVLVFVSKNSRAPKAEGIPYDKGQR